MAIALPRPVCVVDSVFSAFSTLLTAFASLMFLSSVDGVSVSIAVVFALSDGSVILLSLCLHALTRQSLAAPPYQT